MSTGFRLLVVEGNHKDMLVDVTDMALLPIKIGRTDDRPGADDRLIGRPARLGTDLLLDDDPQVSRGHARIEAASNGWLIVDCGSANGTRHNGRLLRPNMPVRLRVGDQISVGTKTVIRFEVPSAEIPEPKPDPKPKPDPVIDTPFLFRTEPPPRDQFGKYAIYDVLDHDDVTQLDVAVDTQGSRRVALKRYDLSKVSSADRRLLQECAERGTRWGHPNIAVISDHGERDGMFYVATHLVEGRGLHSLQATSATGIDIPFALHVSRGVCAALRHAQAVERGFLCRSLTPRSIVMDRQGTPLLVSLGFPSSRYLAGGEAAMLAAPEARYLSPEQRAGRKTDPRSDIYSLGAILYELLLQASIDLGKKFLLEIDLVRPEVPHNVAEVTSRAVRYQPAQRFLHPAEMEEALEAVLKEIAPGYGPDEVAASMLRYLGA